MNQPTLSDGEPRRSEISASSVAPRVLDCDFCVVGAGAAGVSAAVEAARAGLRVVLLDALPQVGGQSVNGLIGTLCGFHSSDAQPHQLHYGFAGEVLRELDAAQALAWRRGRGTLIALYEEQALAALYARHLLQAEVTTVLGAVLLAAVVRDERLALVRVQTRYGALEVRAGTWLDASGDAMLASVAGLPVRAMDAPVYGTTMFSVTADQGAPPREEIERRLQAVAPDYGLTRRDGFVFAFPGRKLCLVNMTHYETPLDAVAMSRQALAAPAAVDAVLRFLRTEFPAAFGNARVASIGQPGVRQTRSIVARAALTTAAVRSGVRSSDAIARSAWPIEFHGRPDGVHWEMPPAGQLAWVPLACMVARDVKNLLAAGRCIDAEPFALSAVRVIGPCMAMGAAAAAAAGLGGGDLHALNPRAVQQAVADNLERRDPGPAAS